MNNRWESENAEPGALERDSLFLLSTWYNAAAASARRVLLSTTRCQHASRRSWVFGNANPTQVTLVPDRLLPSSGMPFPPAPQPWHYHQTIEYLMSANYAVMSYAARNRDDVLFSMYRMAKDSITRGSEDYWTIYPKRVNEMKDDFQKDAAASGAAAGPARTGRMASFAANSLRAILSKYYDEVMKKPELRDHATTSVTPRPNMDLHYAV